MDYSPTTPMTDDFKLTLLKNAVQDASHLASMESAYDVTTQLGSGTPGAIDYNGYMEVLLSAAQNHDAKISPTTRSQNRCANAHSSLPTESYDEEQYDIDTSVDTIWVNAHNTVLAHYSNGTRVSDDAWSKLPQDSQNIWMSLPMKRLASLTSRMDESELMRMDKLYPAHAKALQTANWCQTFFQL
jgi:hypothetical protein